MELTDIEKTNLVEPTDNDVICCHRPGSRNHPGNRRFALIIRMHKDKYFSAVNKKGKSLVAASIVEIVRRCGGRFLRLDKSNGKWFVIEDSCSREVVTRALRRSQGECQQKQGKAQKITKLTKLLVNQQGIFRRLLSEADQNFEEESIILED